MLSIAAMSVLLFFIDGLGIGLRGPQNPLDGLEGAEPLAIFRDDLSATIHDGIVVPTDACLGVEGRPPLAKPQFLLASVTRLILEGRIGQGWSRALDSTDLIDTSLPRGKLREYSRL